ncbi:MAG: carboxylating nicotinate-nucleotide diphosphorylase, partial [Gemmatimonadetes bacterium]|nr:carboxylating nicotinate-nucleotide diphosphorylase [Gemmatimonadota bacterium]
MEARSVPIGPSTVDDEVLQLIDLAIGEDRGAGDWTSRWTIPARTRAHAEIIAKQAGVLAGTTPAMAVFQRLDPRVEAELRHVDGERIEAGAILCSLRGPGRAILTGERVALNFLQRLSGIATMTRCFVQAVAGTRARILDTRKTTPGWRVLEKAAVRAGGGENHRSGLFDAILIKENHIAIAGSLVAAATRVHEANSRRLPVIIEVRTLGELDEALAVGTDRVLLDNMDIETIREAVRRVRRRKRPPNIEASGNMTLKRVRAVAETGVDFISVGALTHSAHAL